MDSGFDRFVTVPARTGTCEAQAVESEHGFALGLQHVVAILALVLAASALFG